VYSVALGTPVKAMALQHNSTRVKAPDSRVGKGQAKNKIVD